MEFQFERVYEYFIHPSSVETKLLYAKPSINNVLQRLINESLLCATWLTSEGTVSCPALSFFHKKLFFLLLNTPNYLHYIETYWKQLFCFFFSLKYM